MDDRRRQGKTRFRRPSKRWGLVVGGCALLGFPSLGFGGMLDTPLPTFSDGKSAQVVGLLPRVIKKDNLETLVACTNLDTVAANIGLEVFDKDGVLVNSVNAGNGAILNVAVGATRTIGTGRTELLTEDHRILTLPALSNGSGRVVASERDVFCHAMLVDEIHVIADPSFCTPCTPELCPLICPPDCLSLVCPPVPTLVSAPVWACGNSILDPLEECDDGNTMGGDGCETDCSIAAPPGCGNSVVVPPETCDPPGILAGGNGNLCRFNCRVCGDTVVDFGEACDDGNGVNGDGCDNDCQITGPPQSLDPAQQRCINTLNKNMRKVASKQGKDICTCIKDGAKGRLSGSNPIETCLSADRKGKVAKAKDGTISAFGKHCTDTPPSFGATDAATVNDAAAQKEIDLARALFGPDLDAVITAEATGKDESKCQQKVARSAKKCLETRLKEFNKCKKLTLETANGPDDLEACMFLDLSGKIAKFCGRSLSAQVQKRCVLKGVDLTLAFPGIGVSGGSELESALDQEAGCAACRLVNAADALGRDCDMVDDGLMNESCP